MDENRFQEYWKLIYALLNCSNGEEDNILKTNQHLIDDRLVKILLEIASALKAQGNLENADFLMNIARDLIGVYRNLPSQKILTPTATSSIKQKVDFQLDFCFKVLQASRDIKDILKILFPLLQANLNQLNDNFAQLLRSWAITTLCSSTPQTSYWIAVNISNFSNLIKNFPLGNRASNLEIAMTGYEVTDIVITCSEYPYDWAMVKNNLGTVYLDRIRGDRVENLTAAIGYFHDALKIFTREAFPQEWAMAQCNLGIAHWYGYDLQGQPAENLAVAINYFQNALKVRTQEDFPQEWAMAQYNLGSAYFSGYDLQGQPTENLEAAISCFQNALKVFTREAFPQEWAMLQKILGDVYFERPSRRKTENLEAAIGYYVAALEVCTRQAFPYEWALTQYDLGFCYSQRIQGNKSENLELAIRYALAALDVYTREVVPKDWANTQTLLGHAYRQRIAGDRAENLETAIYYYNAALQVYTQQTFPKDWALVQYNLGNTFYHRIRGEKSKNLEIAIGFYSEALKVYTREAFPKDWSKVLIALGDTYSIRIMGERAENVEIAIDYFRNALAICTNEAFPENWAIIQNDLGEAYRLRIAGNKAENLKTAIRYFLAALEVRTRGALPIDWAITQNNLGISYLEMGTSCLGTDFVYRTPKEQEEDLENAIRCLQNALEVNTHEAFPVDWARIQHNLGVCYIHRIQGNHSENLEAAISCFSDALQVYTREAFPLNWAWTQSTLGEVYRQRIQGDKTKNLNAAICYHLAALEVRTKEAFPSDHADTQYNLGLCYQDAQQFHNAYTAFAAAIDTIELLRGEIVLGTGKGEIKQKLAERWSKIYKQMVLVCLELGNHVSAVEYVELSKTRNLVELILKRDLHTIFPSDIASQMEHLQDEIARGQYQLQTAKANDSTVLAQNLQKLRQRYNELQDRYLPIGFGFKFDNFQKTLDDHTAVVQWYLTGAKLITFIFTRHTQQPIVWQSEPNGLKKFQKFSGRDRRAYYVYNSHWKRRLTNRLQLLAKILGINEIVKLIPQECDKLILIPHWELHLFPLHALPISTQHGESKSQILMDRFPKGVGYAPSCQLLQLAQTRKRPNFNHLFAIQNPTKDLDYTDIEVTAIKGYFNRTDILKETTATKAAINSDRLTSFHCTHFSCHGYFNFDNPRKSALILTNAYLESKPQEPDSEHYFTLQDGRVIDLKQCLTLDDIFNLNLEKCRLVVLSACETGITDHTNFSDEYIGLPSGFLYAGSPSVVSSLWKVSDISTAFLIAKFYENLQNESSVAVALNHAQLWLRDATGDELKQWMEEKQFPLNRTLKISLMRQFKHNPQPFQSPFYWAAFCAIGQ